MSRCPCFLRRALALAACLMLLAAPSLPAAEFGFSVDIPDGWWRVNTDRYFMITKDGAFKHYILVQERPLTAPFKNTGRVLEAAMLPHEAAQVIVDELSSDPNLTGFQMVENIPATVAGRPGFRLTFMYTDPAGIVFKTVYYGCIQGQRFYNLRYAASDKAYFTEAAWRRFATVLESFRIH